jgi:hypothetical protein
MQGKIIPFSKPYYERKESRMDGNSSSMYLLNQNLEDNSFQETVGSTVYKKDKRVLDSYATSDNNTPDANYQP